MALRKQTSKKRSASSNDSPPDAGAPLFIDRCAWSRKLGEALRQAGIQFIAHHERFAPACPDEEWMKVAGREGWIVITRDQAIRRKPNELKAFREAKLIMFALASGNASADDTARLVVELYPRIVRKAHSSKPPAMFSVTLAGGINPVR
jgi:predicted nuclease of predicted toxin-antitoxin system